MEKFLVYPSLVVDFIKGFGGSIEFTAVDWCAGFIVRFSTDINGLLPVIPTPSDSWVYSGSGEYYATYKFVS